MKTQLQLDAEWMEVAADGLGGPDLALSGGPDGADSDLAKRGRPSAGVAAAGDHLKQRCMQSFSLGHEGGMAGNLQTGGQCPGEPGRFSANGSKPEGYASGGDGASECESDESVLKRLNDGEQRAMGELWGRYAGLLFSQALRVLHNAAEAEDVVVEVFSEVWRRAGGYHPERARPAAWLVTLVRRRAIDRFRERRSHERAEERLALERGGGRERIDGIEEQVRLSELRRLLELALERLPERQREAVCMVYFEGLTQREISKRTRTPIGTVKTRLELGLRKMRERIRLARMRPGLDLEKGVESPEQDAPASRTGRFP
jgi:RNA polymerase sigma-70 factor (ECF subfamily)